MAKIGQPPDGSATNRVVGGKILPLVAPQKGPPVALQKPENKAETGGTFDPTASKEVALPEATTGAVGAGVKARLAALGVGTLPIKQTKVARITDTPIGKILDGSVLVENARALSRLEGVVRITGSLTLQEAQLTGGEVTPVNGLVEIEGRLTIEGVHSRVAHSD
ncbi:MAG TPA: hypothetical protein VGO62_06550 [Myxococcota bacterium]|jgi:hypothetical protein